jgi:hypothetical protein
VVVGDAGLVPDILNKIALHEVRSELSTLKILVTRSPSLGLGLSENVSVAPQDIALLEQQAIVELSTVRGLSSQPGVPQRYSLQGPYTRHLFCSSLRVYHKIAGRG